MYTKTILACVVVAACFAVPTAGYASLEAAIPPVEAIARPAADLTLSFSYKVDLERSRFEILDHNSQRVPFSELQVYNGGTNVVVPIDARLPPGKYKLRWTAFSEDGRAETGTYLFNINP